MQTRFATAPTRATSRATTAPQGRRMDRRTPYRVLCRLLVEDRALGRRQSLIGQTINISPGGLAVRVGQEIPSGTEVTAVVPRQHGDPVLYTGVVAHCRRVLAVTYELGIEFE